MKKLASVAAGLVFASALVGCNNDEVVSSVQLAFGGYVLLQDQYGSEKGSAGSWSAIGFDAHKEITKYTKDDLSYKEMFEVKEIFESGMKGFGVLSKTDINGCPAKTIWALVAGSKPEGFGVKYTCLVQPSDASKAAECDKVFKRLRTWCE